MHLVELFQEPPLEMNDEMRNMMLDILTPLAAQKVPFVTIQQVIDKLREFRTGIALDRGLIMDILDPNKLKIVQKIEGDRIYLNRGGAPERATSQDDAEKEDKLVHNLATDQAQKAAGDPPSGGAL